MGSNTEFSQKNNQNHLNIYGKGHFNPGQVTDDSEMAMSQAFAILDNYKYNSLNQNLLYYYYVLWFSSIPLDVGITIRKALSFSTLNNVSLDNENIFNEDIKKKILKTNNKSLANGFLMRASPFLTWFYMINKDFIKQILETKSTDKYFELYKKIHKEMEKDAQITHPNPENAISGSIVIFMGLCSIQQKYSGKEILEMVGILFKNNYFKSNNEIEYKIKIHFEKVLKKISEPNFSKDNFFGNLSFQMGFYKHAFNLIIYYLYIFDDLKKKLKLKDIFNNIMYDISDFGGDTDTNGAIVGMIMGPLIGMENFDSKYFDCLLNFYSKKRLIYTNAFMYFYAVYLKKIENSKLPISDDNKYKVNFNFIKILLDMLNTDIKNSL